MTTTRKKSKLIENELADKKKLLAAMFKGAVDGLIALGLIRKVLTTNGELRLVLPSKYWTIDLDLK